MLHNSRTFAYLITEGYLHKALVSIRSIQEFSSHCDFHIAYFAPKLPSQEVKQLFGSNVYWHLKGEPRHFTELYAERPNFVLELFQEGYESVCHIGADVVAYQNIDQARSFDLAAAVHCQLPEDNKIISTHHTGLISSDLCYWKNNIYTTKFLQWQAAQLRKVNSDKDGHFFDQVYLDYAITSLFTKLLSPDQYGKAYYNLHEGFNKSELKCFHFSGFMEQFPTTLTRFNVKREYLTADVIQLALEYGKRLYDAKEEIIKANQA